MPATAPPGDGGAGRAASRRDASLAALSSGDPVDAYLIELGATPPLTREQELELAVQIEERTNAAFTIVVDSGVLLPELTHLAQQIAQGKLAAVDVLADPAADARAHHQLVRKLARIGRLELQAAAIHSAAAGQPHPRGRRCGCRSKLAANRQRRSSLLRSLRLRRAQIEPMVVRIAGCLQRLAAAQQALSAGSPADRWECRAIVAELEGELGQRWSPQLRRIYHRLQPAWRHAEAAKDELTQANLRLVVAFARKFRGRGVPLGDLIQEGNIGLMRAVEKFDHRVGTKFSTYAGWWLRQSMQRAIISQGQAVRVPVHRVNARTTTALVDRELRATLGREPGREEIAAVLGISAQQVTRNLALPSVRSLDETIGDGEHTLADLVACEKAVDPQRAAVDADRFRLARRAIESLSPREQLIIRKRFGIDCLRSHTLAEIGTQLSLTRERIRQIEAEALLKLRRALSEQAG